MIDVFTAAGFRDVAIAGRFDCFAGTNKERTARRYQVMGVNLTAVRAVSEKTPSVF